MANQNKFLEELVNQYIDALSTLKKVNSNEYFSVYDGKTITATYEKNLATLLNLYIQEYHLDINEVNKKLGTIRDEQEKI